MPPSTMRWDSLPMNLQGTLTLPGAPHYETSRRVWNGMIDRRRPADSGKCVAGRREDGGAVPRVRYLALTFDHDDLPRRKMGSRRRSGSIADPKPATNSLYTRTLKCLSRHALEVLVQSAACACRRTIRDRPTARLLGSPRQMQLGWPR
jgi:hypothetical protein